MTVHELGTLRADGRPFTFVHAADLHLGASDHVQAALGNLVRLALGTNPAHPLDAPVDALLLAGDVYDAAARSPHLQMKFLAALEELDRAGVLVFVAHGNHDPLAGTFRPVVGELPANVRVFDAGDPQTYRFTVAGRTVAVTGVSFGTRHDGDNLVQRVAGSISRNGVAADLQVAVVHANVAGQPGHDNYAPCTVEDLRTSGVHYWALGHIHTRTVTSMGGGRWWAYPGNLQGRSLKPAECDSKGALVVTAAGTAFDDPKFVACDVHRFLRVEVQLDGVQHYGDAHSLVRNALEGQLEASGPAFGEPRSINVRVTMTGATPVDELHRITPESLVEEIDNPRLTVDRVVDRTHRPVDRAALAGSDTLVGGVLRRVDELLARTTDQSFEELLQATGEKAGAAAVARVRRLVELGQLDPAQLPRRAEELVLDAYTGAEQ